MTMPMTETEFAAEHEKLDAELAFAHGRVAGARGTLIKTTKALEVTTTDYLAQWPVITREQNIRWTLARAQEIRADRKAQGLPLDGPAVAGRHGPSKLDHIAANQRGGRRAPQGSDTFRRGGSLAKGHQIPRLPSQK